MLSVLILGASGGIGGALAAHHRRQGHQVVSLSRRDDGFDITDEACVAAQLGALDIEFDRIVVATGALEIAGAVPEKTIKGLSARGMADQFAVNAIGPALILSQAHRLLPKKRSSALAVLSARVGSIGDNHIGGWISYRAAKAALNQIVRTASIELARSHPEACVLALHPGTVETQFSAKYAGRHPTVSAAQAAAHLAYVMENAQPEQTGHFYDYAGRAIVW